MSMLDPEKIEKSEKSYFANLRTNVQQTGHSDKETMDILKAELSNVEISENKYHGVMIAQPSSEAPRHRFWDTYAENLNMFKQYTGYYIDYKKCELII